MNRFTVVSPFCDGLDNARTNEIYCSVTNSLNATLLYKTIGRFYVKLVLLVGSFAEDTRTQDNFFGIDKKEFDFLLICNVNPCQVYNSELDSQMFLADLEITLRQTPFTFSRTANGKPEILFNYLPNIKIVIDIHAALEMRYSEGYPVYSVLLHSPGAKWRNSNVMKEIALFRSFRSHNKPYRLVKLLLRNLPEYLGAMNYHAKTVMMHHMCYCLHDSQYGCAVHVLHSLHDYNNNGFLPNVHDRERNVLETGWMYINDGILWLCNLINQLA